MEQDCALYNIIYRDPTMTTMSKHLLTLAWKNLGITRLVVNSDLPRMAEFREGKGEDREAKMHSNNNSNHNNNYNNKKCDFVVIKF